jgi:hypothetical protein
VLDYCPTVFRGKSLVHLGVPGNNFLVIGVQLARPVHTKNSDSQKDSHSSLQLETQIYKAQQCENSLFARNDQQSGFPKMQSVMIGFLHPI